MAVIPLGKGLWQTSLGKALLSHARGSVPLSPLLVLQRRLGWPGSPPADAVRWSALLCRGDAEEEPQTAAGQSTDPGFHCPGSARPLAGAASPPAVGTPALVVIAWSSALAFLSSGKI